MNPQHIEAPKKDQKKDNEKEQNQKQGSWWQSVVGTALVGTDRQSPEKLSEDSSLGNVLNQLDWQKPEDALLKAAGIFSVYQQSGQQSVRKYDVKDYADPDAKSEAEHRAVELAEVEPAEPDTEACCSARISAHLTTGLNQYPQAVEELLGLIAGLDQRVSPVLLPAVLRYGEKFVAAQAAIEAVLGNRGRWLAAQNPAWQYVRQDIDTVASDAVSDRDVVRWRSHWQSGTKKQRLAAITKWRQIDPDGAREAIAASWKSEDWRTRETMLGVLVTNLTMADEAFLETALSDRAAAVKKGASTCLSQLPESRLCQRMAERIQAFVHTKHIDENLTIDIRLPETFDSNWQKDGIQKTSVHQLSDQASWVAQILARTPLSYWAREVEQLQEILSHQAMSQHDRLILLNGWSQAICYQRTTPLAKAWVSLLLPQQDFQAWEPAVLSDMLSLLSAEKKEQYLRAQFPRQNNDQASSHWLQLVADSQQRWDYDFSRLVLTQLTQVMKGKRKYGDLFSPSAEIALFLHPGLATEAERMVENWTQNHRPTKAWQRFLDEFLGILGYRWQMYQLFAESG